MDKTFLDLFKQIAHTVEVTAEKVMDYNNSLNNKESYENAQRMRADYSQLYDKMREENFDFSSLTRNEIIKILIGVLIVTQNLKDQIQAQNKAIEGYENNIIPKFQQAIEEGKTDKEVIEILEKLFNEEKN